MKRGLITILVFSFTTLVFAQKKAITHDDYDLWKKISNVAISNQGKLILTTIETATKRGDGYLEIYNTKSKQKIDFFNGYEASATYDEAYVIFKRKPSYKTIRKEKSDKIEEKKKAKETLFIYDVKNNALFDSIYDVSTYKLSKKNSDWLIINKEIKSKKNKNKDSTSHTLNQNYTIVYNLNTKEKDTIFKIKDITISETANRLFYTLKSKNKHGKDLGIYEYHLKSGLRTVIDTSKYAYNKLETNKKGDFLAYVAAADSAKVDDLQYELYLYKKDKVEKLISRSDNNLKENWELSGDQSLSFSENGKRLYFYSKPKNNYQINPELLDDEIPEVDVWTWQDKIIQPRQKANFKELSKEAFLSYYNIEEQAYIHLQDITFDGLIFDKEKEQKFILGVDTSPYDIQSSWDRPRKRDYYIINSKTGENRIALNNTASQPILTPDGNHAIYFDRVQQHWFALNLTTSQKRNLTQSLGFVFHDIEYDRPALIPSYGFGGFDKDGNALVYDKFDIWKLSIDGKKTPVNLTKNDKNTNTVYRTLKLDKEHKELASYADEKLLITSFNRTTKASGLYVLHKEKLLERIAPSDFLINRYKKAKEANVFVFTKENFNTYPDLHITTDTFKSAKKITRVNSQQDSFKWGTAELFTWTAYDGKKLEGIIYKPDNFDPSKKYPLITYFYERRSDGLRLYAEPKPSASTVNKSYLVSNDYVLFVPDIVYNTGNPGDDAYNCIVSGVEAIENLGFIDSENMAIQGQSWGGYQVAYLITVTNKFKAAMAGAPVSNMTSAYGGIRWESGQSRTWQYEKAQSRIGKTLWDGLDLYIKNSPLFGIPKIETPLLMMHNDADGAVPYYQGIEMFMGMRRLQKPVWLLVYNNESHNLKKIKNKQDLSIRMMQFFDHYLKGKPAPEWMIKGVPLTQKGKDLGYGLIDK